MMIQKPSKSIRFVAYETCWETLLKMNFKPWARKLKEKKVKNEVIT